MDVALLTVEKLLPRFQELLAASTRVDIASAWATDGKALDALERAAKRPHKPVDTRAIVGIHGNATTPEALDRINALGQLRLATADRMFHAKTYIFGNRQWTVGWIGSANFTGKGFEANEELVFETRHVKQLEAWFDDRWRRCGELDPRALGEYRERYKQDPPSPALDQTQPPSSKTPAKVIFKSHGQGADRRYPGKCILIYADGGRMAHSYESHAGALRFVLEELSRNGCDDEFLEELARTKTFHRGRNEIPLLSRDRSSVFQEPDKGIHPKRLGSGGWWLSQNTTSGKKMRLIKQAAELAGVRVVDDQKSRDGF